MKRLGLLLFACIVVLAAAVGQHLLRGQDAPGTDGAEPAPPEGSEGLRSALAQHGVPTPAFRAHHSTESGTVYRFDVDAAQAIATWGRLRALVDKLGCYPLVCRDEHGMLADATGFNATLPAETIRIAGTIDAPTWFRKRTEEDPEYYGKPELGTWEETETQAGWTVPRDILTNEPAKDLFIALVPTTRPWEALAYMHVGGWNACPAPESHVAVQREWHERYGAEIVCLAGDTVEMRVARPPTDRERALALAKEQFVYSGGDLVFQGHGTLRRLAGALVGARYWYFWWD